MQVGMINSISYSRNVEVTASFKQTVKINRAIHTSDSRPALKSIPKEDKDVFDLLLDRYQKSSLATIMPEEKDVVKQTYDALPFAVSNNLLPPPPMNTAEDDEEKSINQQTGEKSNEGSILHDYLVAQRDKHTLLGKQRTQYSKRAESTVSHSRGLLIDLKA